MENTETVGSLLKREREGRGLSLQDVMDATKITINNLAALEEDRFDYFPNRVYTRAFLRDYSNYLGLDSGELLEKYEQTWGNAKDPSAGAPVRRRSGWKVAVSVLAVLAVLGALALASYVYVTGRGMSVSTVRPSEQANPSGESGNVATLPKAPVVPTPEPPKPDPAKKPIEAPKPVVMSRPETMTVQVKALKYVYVGAVVDGKKAGGTNMDAGDIQIYKGKKTVRLTVGIADGVQVKWNGVVQPPLGTSRDVGRPEYEIAKSPMVPTPVEATKPLTGAPTAPTAPAGAAGPKPPSAGATPASPKPARTP